MGSLSSSGFTVCHCLEVRQWHCCDVGFLPRGPLCWQSIDLSGSAESALIAAKSSTLTLSCPCQSPEAARGSVCADLVLLYNNMQILHLSSSLCITEQLSVVSVWTRRLPNISELLGNLLEYKYCAISESWPWTCFILSTEGQEGFSHATVLFDYGSVERQWGKSGETLTSLNQRLLESNLYLSKSWSLDEKMSATWNEWSVNSMDYWKTISLNTLRTEWKIIMVTHMFKAASCKLTPTVIMENISQTAAEDTVFFKDSKLYTMRL